MGFMCGIELESVPNHPGKRAYETFKRCYEKGVLVRSAGDTIALTPPFIISEKQIDEIINCVGEALQGN